MFAKQPTFTYTKITRLPNFLSSCCKSGCYCTIDGIVAIFGKLEAYFTKVARYFGDIP